MANLIKPPIKPCGSCPYVKSTPSGIWDKSEYLKLIEYDKETTYQPMAVFMCHQKNNCICGGWLMTHDVDHLLALRIARNVCPSVYSYAPKSVDVYESGEQACNAGLLEIETPSLKAVKKIKGLRRLRSVP